MVLSDKGLRWRKVKALYWKRKEGFKESEVHAV